MSEYRSFIEAICAEPDEDTHRLVFADYLAENDALVEMPCPSCAQYAHDPENSFGGIGYHPERDPASGRHEGGWTNCKMCGSGKPGVVIRSNRFAVRAEFIRLQCEIAKCPPQHKQPSYPEEPTSLKTYGDKHYSFVGYAEEGFGIGDRVDLLVHRPMRKPKMMYGFRVYNIVWLTGPAYHRDEQDIFVRRDAESGPWKGAKLKERQDALLESHCDEWFPLFDNLWQGFEHSWNGLSDPATFTRGFVSALHCTAADFLKHAPALCWHPKQTIACHKCNGTGQDVLVDTQRYGGRWLERINPQCPNCTSGRISRPCPESAQPITHVMLTDFHAEFCGFDIYDPIWEMSRHYGLGWRPGDEPERWLRVFRAEWPWIEFNGQRASEDGVDGT